jgi:hypothetical protein
MAAPLRGANGDPGAPTTYVGGINGGPLGGADGDPGVLATYVRDVGGGPPRRHFQRPRSTHHLSQRHRWWVPWEALTETREPHHLWWRRRWWVPWEALPETQEHPPRISETLMAGALGSPDGDLGVPTTYV